MGITIGWYEFENGGSIGKEGSEEGIIILDEEHSDGARLTIEKDGITAPFSITCGIYGLMAHTAFFSSLQEANNAAKQMKLDIENLMKLDGDELYNSLSDFTEKY